jgi:hypothetical protein
MGLSSVDKLPRLTRYRHYGDANHCRESLRKPDKNSLRSNRPYAGKARFKDCLRGFRTRKSMSVYEKEPRCTQRLTLTKKRAT